MAFPSYNPQRPPTAHPQTGHGPQVPQRPGGFGGMLGGIMGGRVPMQRPEPSCRITSTEDGLLQDKLKINCDCSCNYEQTDTVLLGRSTNISNCDARQMQQINALRNLAGRR
ncbi:MAG: hypothetical protein KC800_29020 [Candidatus Eremiobacteraeota bacterium]|nr:hypothetical protein [Candidatus Eremiobacteraeota bacterium]